MCEFFAAGLSTERKRWPQIESSLGGPQNPHPGNITNVGHILKMQMRGRTKMVIEGEHDYLLGVDLLNDNLYLNSAAIKGLKGLPLNSAGRLSIPLQDLRTPNGLGTYVVDGRVVSMTHGEALRKFFEVAKGPFSLPDDFMDNILWLAQYTDSLFEEILLPPSATARATIREVTGAVAAVHSATDQFRTYQNRSEVSPETARLIEQHSEIRILMQRTLLNLQRAILANDQREVQRIAKIILDQDEQRKALVEQIDRKPSL